MDGSAGRQEDELSVPPLCLSRGHRDTTSCPSPLTGAIEVLGEGEAQAEDDGLRPQHLPRRRHLLLPRESRVLAQPRNLHSGRANWAPPWAHVPTLPMPALPGTHIEEADVHVEVDVHVIDGPVLPVKTHGAVAWGAGTVLEQWPGTHRARVGRLMGQ